MEAQAIEIVGLAGATGFCKELQEKKSFRMLLRHATVLHHFSQAFARCHLLCCDLINGGSCGWPTDQKAT
jgi:hypothetical protein